MVPRVQITPTITTKSERITALKNRKNMKINNAVTKMDKYINIFISSATLLLIMVRT